MASWQADPTGHEYPEHMAMGEQCHPAFGATHLGDHPIHPFTDLIRGFTPWSAIREQQPAGMALLNLSGGETLERSVVPFGEIFIDPNPLAQAGQLARL